MKVASWTVGLLAVLSIIERVHIELLRYQRDNERKSCRAWESRYDQAKTNAVFFEQLYRDCQAARQFSEPAHAADAVNDVTR